MLVRRVVEAAAAGSGVVEEALSQRANVLYKCCIRTRLGSGLRTPRWRLNTPVAGVISERAEGRAAWRLPTALGLGSRG